MIKDLEASSLNNFLHSQLRLGYWDKGVMAAATGYYNTIFYESLMSGDVILVLYLPYR